MHRLSRFLVLLVGLAVTASGSLCRGQASAEPAAAPAQPVASLDELLLFFPAKHPVGNWTPEGLRFEDVWFASADGTRLHGWYCPCENRRAVVLLTRGNGGNITHRGPWLKLLQTQLRVATLTFDYRGYGRSAGAPTVSGVLEDARAARRKLVELAGIKDAEMLLMGESLGGAVAVQLAAESAPRGLVLQSTFSSLRDVAEVHYPRLAWLVPPGKLDSAALIGRYRGPLLQSHGTADRTIPFSSGEKLFRAANEPKRLMAIAGAGHNDWLTAEYVRELDEFVAKYDGQAAAR